MFLSDTAVLTMKTNITVNGQEAPVRYIKILINM